MAFLDIDGLTYSSLARLPKNADRCYQYILTRLLLGIASVSKGTTICRQSTDYSIVPQNVQARKPTDAFKEFLTTYGIGGTVQGFVRKTIADNREFYADLLGEFSNFFIQTERKSHTSAFVFLYRILERLSYCTPLLYSSTQSDYRGTFNDLKALFASDNKGELGLFKVFLNNGRFIDQLKLDVPYLIDFSLAYFHKDSFFDLTVARYREWVSNDKNTHQLEIKFRHIPELLQTVRNRFFHFRVGDGQPNIRLAEMPDSDEYFSCLNPSFCSCMAVIVLHTLARKYQT